MKNLLLSFVTAIVLFSCSSQDGVINQNEVIEKEDLMLIEENAEEIKLRTASPDIPIYAPSNLQEIYEYASMENGKYYDFYYKAKKNTDPFVYTFVDSRSGRTYTYQRVLGKFANNLLPYHGSYFGIEKCRLVYIPSSKTYSFVVYEVRRIDGDYYEPNVIAEELGYTLSFADFDDRHNYSDGHWGLLKYYTSKEGNNDYRVGTKRLFDTNDIEDWDAVPEWYKKWAGIALLEIGTIVK